MRLTSSIAMCTYNGAKYLQAQLDSLASQTVLPDELVVCDDGSTDATISILKSFAAAAPFPVRIYQNEQNLGYGKNFEKAAKQCTQDVIFFCDQDDVWRPEKIETVLSEFQNRPDVGLILHGYDAIGIYGQPIEIFEPLLVDLSDVRDFILPSVAPFIKKLAPTWYGCMMAFRYCWCETLFPIEGGAHDTWVLNYLPCLTDSLYLDRALIAHRIHENNTADRRQKPYSNWGVWRFIPRLYNSILKRLGVSDCSQRKVRLLREAILKRLEDVSEIKHPELAEYYRHVL